MTVTVKPLVVAKYLENSLTTQYAANNVRAIIDKFTVTNVSSSNVSVDVHLVPASGSANVSNTIVDNRVIAPQETYTFPELVGHSLEPGGSIAVVASAASATVLRISGREVT